MTHPTGKGIYIWQLQNCGFGSDMPALVADLVAAKVNHVAVKRHDGASLNYDVLHVPLVAPFIAACKQAGIAVWLWGYLYGISIPNAQTEANTAALALDMHPDAQGYIIDAEAEFKVTAGKSWATAFVNQFRAKKPTTPLGLSSFRFPTLHSNFPFAEFLVKCDFHYPQMYWVLASNPGAQLQQSYNELIALKDIPYIPAGCGYCFEDWCPTGAQWAEFNTQAKALSLPGISGWSLQHLRNIVATWTTYKSLTWSVPPPPPPPTTEYVTRAEFDAALANLMLLIRPPMTHKVNTTDANGEKLRNNPDSGEHVMLKHGTEVRKLSSVKWKGQHLYGLIINNYPVWGYLADSEVLPK